MKLFRTHNFALIQQACLEAQVNKTIVQVVGVSGLGMTTAFRYFQENGPTLRVWYLSTRSGGFKAWVNSLAHQALPECRNLPSRAHALLDLTIECINDQQRTTPLLIVDNFRLNYDLIHLLDALYCGSRWAPQLGIVLGTNRNEIARIRRHKERIGRIANKILRGNEFELQSPRRDEVAAIAGADPSSDIVTELVLKCPTYTSLQLRLQRPPQS